MFKDYDKYLSTSLKVYIFVLVLVLIMKLVGMDYFGLALDNAFVIKINNFILKSYTIQNLIFIIPLLISQYIIISISLNDNTRKLLLFNFLTTPILFVFECYKLKLFGNFSMLIEILYFILLIVLYKRKVNFKEIKRLIIIIIITILFQAISTLIRFRYSILYVDNVIANLLLNLDYIIALLIFHNVYFKKGDVTKWFYQVEVSLSSLKKINLKKSLKRLQVNLRKFRALPKQERLSISIYIVLSLLWNTLSLVIILLIANLNHTFIECLFILTSFWLSKHAFGKPFHLPSMIHCFIVSNLTYYILNRITTPLGISIFIPILLGVGLSYVTSKLVKKTYKPLYRGMPKELFNETILKIVDKDSIKYKICYDSYINKKSDLSLSFEYNYSVAGIRKIKNRINDKVKELN